MKRLLTLFFALVVPAQAQLIKLPDLPPIPGVGDVIRGRAGYYSLYIKNYSVAEISVAVSYYNPGSSDSKLYSGGSGNSNWTTECWYKFPSTDQGRIAITKSRYIYVYAEGKAFGRSYVWQGNKGDSRDVWSRCRGRQLRMFRVDMGPIPVNHTLTID